MKLGAERKKVAILGALVLVGGYTFYTNVLSTPSAGPPAPRSTAPVPAASPAASVPAGPVRRAIPGRTATQEFRPSLKRRPEDQIDPMQIDPTLRTDLLAKVQGVGVEGGSRNIFQFSAPPAPPLPKTPEPKIIPKTPGAAQTAGNGGNAAAPSGPPPPPPPPPILLKYYGYSTQRADGKKRAFFLDGEDILVAGEGEVVKKRYKVVRIGINSVVMEDVESKRQQSLPLQEEAMG